MRKIFSVLILLIAIASINAQGIQKDYVDAFTKKHIVETTNVPIYSLLGGTLNCSFKAVGSDLAMIVKVMELNHFSVEDGKKIAVLLSDSSVIWFVNPQYTISSLGGGATGFAGSSAPGLTVKAFSEDILRIADNQLLINCIRVYTSEGYLDFGVTPNKAQIIKQNLLLILNSMDTPQNLINVENYSFNNKKNHYEDYSPEDYSEYICQDKYISSSGKYTIRVYTLKNPAIKTIPVCVDVYNRAQEGEFLLKADIEQYVKKKKNK